jgi:tripartite ATP-independent transporter DctM subunit
MTVLPLVLLVLGFPIFVILLATSAIVIVCFYSIPPTALQQVMFGTLDSSALLAVPFFIFAGEIMGFGGISRRLVDWTKSLLGATKASLPITTVGTCVVFGAISGSSAATVAAVGRITFAPMVAAGYDVRFAAGLLTASGLIDNMIPPAIAMILYAAVAEQSLVRIFTAGFVPGFLFALAFVAYILVKSWRSTTEAPEPFSWERLARETVNAAWALGMPLIVLGGIYSGLFSATEAGGIACVYAIVVATAVYREVGFRDFVQLSRRAAYITSQIMIIVASAGVLRASGLAALGAAADHQRSSAHCRLLHRYRVGDPAAHADPGADRQGRRHRPRAFRHRDDGQSQHRLLHAAVRHQHFRGASGVQAAGVGDLCRRCPFHRRERDRARADHLCAGALALSHEAARLSGRLN